MKKRIVLAVTMILLVLMSAFGALAETISGSGWSYTDTVLTITGNIGRDPRDRKRMAIVSQGGKPAVTHYRVLERFGNYTYCEFSLETGRTHQIRVHMASKGHPLLGDDVYGPKKCPYSLEGQTLHAMVLGFRHPRTGEYMEFSAPLPEYFEKLLVILRCK